PVPKPRGPPTVSMLQRAAYWPSPARTTHLSDACQANPKRGITLVFVLNDCVGAPFAPAKETEPRVLVTGLVIVGLKPPKLFWTSLIPPCVSERTPRLMVTFGRNLMSSCAKNEKFLARIPCSG